MRLALTKIRRRWLSATKPTTRGAAPGRPGTATMSWIRPIVRARRRRAAAAASPGTRRSARLPCGESYAVAPAHGAAAIGPIGRQASGAARSATSVSLKATPPPQSVSVSLVSALAALPSGCCVLHQPNGIATTPGRSRVGDPDRQLDAGAVVPHPRQVAVGEAARRGVGRRRARRTGRPRPGRAWAGASSRS